MIKTFSFKIRHSKNYSEWIEQTLGTTRYVYNLAKETKETAYKGGVSLNKFDLMRQLTQCKKEEGFEWLNDCPSGTLQTVIERLDNTYKKFFKGAGYPKWASKDKWKSILFKSVKQIHNGYIKLPKIGVVKVFNPRIIEGDLKTAIIVKEADGYYIKVQAEVENTVSEGKDVCGIDRGVKYFAVTSDGEYIDNPKINQKTEKRLRVLNRKLSRAKKGSKNREQVKNQLQKLHLKRRRQRTDFLHKLTTSLSKEYDTIILENLNTSDMVKNKQLSASISDMGWYQFEQLLSYKTKVVKVDPAYTSQTCSNCGHVDKKSRVSQSEFKCTNCGFEMNADENACQEILKRGRAYLSNANVVQ